MVGICDPEVWKVNCHECSNKSRGERRGLRFAVPTSRKELRRWGRMLHNCVGDVKPTARSKQRWPQRRGRWPQLGDRRRTGRSPHRPCRGEPRRPLRTPTPRPPQPTSVPSRSDHNARGAAMVRRHIERWRRPGWCGSDEPSVDLSGAVRSGAACDTGAHDVGQRAGLAPCPIGVER